MVSAPRVECGGYGSGDGHGPTLVRRGLLLCVVDAMICEASRKKGPNERCQGGRSRKSEGKEEREGERGGK